MRLRQCDGGGGALGEVAFETEGAFVRLDQAGGVGQAHAALAASWPILPLVAPRQRL